MKTYERIIIALAIGFLLFCFVEIANASVEPDVYFVKQKFDIHTGEPITNAVILDGPMNADRCIEAQTGHISKPEGDGVWVYGCLADLPKVTT